MMTAEQLKNSIYQLAIEGKLVDQKIEEGTGRELFIEIQTEKKKLIKEGKLKKHKTLPEITEDKIPFDIPNSWEWVNLGELISVISGASYKKGDVQNSGIRILRGGNLSNMEVTIKEDDVFLPSEHYDQQKQVQIGDILVVASTGSKTVIGKPGFIDRDLPNTMIGAFLRICRPVTLELASFLKLLFGGEYYRKHIRDLAQGTNINNVKEEYITNLIIPLPPLAEQKRIVAKIEELMSFVEQYAVASTKLNTLNASFPEMMKKSILQEAVHGKLVPQDPNDEPASVLLKKIAEEKKRLIKEGKIKKEKYEYCVEHRKEGFFCVTQKGMTQIDEMIFDLPDNWTFCTLSELVQFIGGYAYKSNLFVKDSSYQVLRLGNVKNDSLKLDVNPVYITENLAKETQEFLVRHNDILLTMTGTRLKRDYFYTVCVGESDNSLFINQRVGCLRPYYGEMSKWLSYVLKSNYVLDFIFNYETGTANQGNLGAENIMKIIIPLPPINEQKRIVKMLDELTAINKELLIGSICG